MTDLQASAGVPVPQTRRGAKATLLLALLVVGADLLLWQAPIGLNLFLLFALTGGAVLALARVNLSNRAVRISLVVWLVSLLPLPEAPSWTGALVALGGSSLLALAVSKRLPRHFEDLTATLLMFGLRAPFRLLGDVAGFAVSGRRSEGGLGRRLVRSLLAWVVPGLFALAFIMLFSEANPVIEDALRLVRIDSLFDLVHPVRMVFWGVVAATIWPLLRPKLWTWPKAQELQGPQLPRAESAIFGRSAILNSLLVFNLLFAVQTVSDALYLWGGVRLPDGLSYADYAHRGAYPLIVTALLAAGFVLAAMRPNGPAAQSVLIRRLVYLWIAQNVGLVLSSILRLDLYVKVYSLTELRLAAGVWMALVAVGLVLILLRIVWRRSNAWLVTMNLVALGGTLLMCSFVDAQAVIAQFNVDNSRELGGEGQPLDLAYLEELGPSAIPAIVSYLDRADSRTEEARRGFDLLAGNLALSVLETPADWRGWTFRQQRLRAYIAANPHFAGLAAQGINGPSIP